LVFVTFTSNLLQIINELTYKEIVYL
jgi:hypothetical protein